MQYLTQSLTFPGGNNASTINGPITKFTTLEGVVSGAMPFVFGFAGLVLLIMIILAGFTLLTSAGDAKKLEQGKSRLTYAIVGFLVLFAAYWITQIIGVSFGIEEIKRIFP